MLVFSCSTTVLPAFSPRRCLVAGLLWAILLFSSTVALAEAPRWPRLSITDDPARTMTVTWTVQGQDATWLEWGEEEVYRAAFPAESEETGSNALGVTHHLTLHDLKPDSRYRYRLCTVESCTQGYSFQTLPDEPNAPLRFAVLGDSRASRALFSKAPAAAPGYREVLQAAQEAGARFVLHTGDLLIDGRQENQWPDHLNHEQPIAAELPILYALGNHDDGPGEGDGQYFNKLYSYPRNPETHSEDFYRFQTASALFVVLTPYSFDEKDFAVQTRFLEASLEGDSHPWRFVMLHTPLYTCPMRIAGRRTGHKPDESGAGRVWEPVIVRHGVDAVFSGHNHIFELFGPQDPTRPPASHLDGPIHITSGGAASGDSLMLGKPDEDCPGRLAASDHFHLVLLTLESGTMRVEYLDLGDRFGSPPAPFPQTIFVREKESGIPWCEM